MKNRMFEEMMKAAKIRLADEDFPASGRLLTDSSAKHYLTIEDAVTVGEVLLEKLA